MRRSRKRSVSRKKLIYIVGGIVMVFGLSIAYAALNTSLNVMGAAEVEGNDWNITMEINNTSDGLIIHTPTVDKDHIRNFYPVFDYPGDSDFLMVTVNNKSKLLAEITDIIVGTPVCTSDTGNKEDEDLVCNNINVSIKYSDGTPVEKGDILYQAFPQDDLNYSGMTMICKSEDTAESIELLTSRSRNIKIQVEYSKDIDRVPSSKVTVYGLDFKFVFGQTHNDCNYERNSMFS